MYIYIRPLIAIRHVRNTLTFNMEVIDAFAFDLLIYINVKLISIADI